MKTRSILAILLCVAVWFVSCSKTDDIPTPIVPTVPAKAVVTGATANECPASTVLLTATAAGATAYVWYNGTTKITGATAGTYEVIATGAYSAAGVNETGEGEKSDEKTVTISICDLSTTVPAKAVVAGADASVCPDKTVILTATAASATAYVWYNGATKITGATANTYAVTATGNYSVAGTNVIGEGEKSELKAVTIGACTVTLLNLDNTNNTAEDWNNAGLLFVDGDGDGENWEIHFEHNEKGAWSQSYKSVGIALTPENYLFLPPMTIVSNGKFTFTAEVFDEEGYAEEKFKIIIGEASKLTDLASYRNPEIAEVLYTRTMDPVDYVYTHTVDIPAKYNGKEVRIGIVHFDSTNLYFLVIEQLKVEYVD